MEGFRALLSTPPHTWCWCVAWEFSTWDGWTERSEDDNRGLREELWSQGEYQGYLLYLDEIPIGWCRVGPRRTWPKLCQARGLDASEETFSFVCFGIAEEHRSKGYMHELMRLVLLDLARRGVTRVEGFPRAPRPGLGRADVWMGPYRLFEAAGFRELSRSEGSIHMVIDLSPGGAP